LSPKLTLDDVMSIQPVIPVIVIDDAADAAPLAEALVHAGLPVLEVTLRTPAALDAIRVMHNVKGAIVGAGTVLSLADGRAAIARGARFIVTPGFSKALTVGLMADGSPVLAGVATSSDIMAGLEIGLDRFKFFPAEQAGGVAMLNAFGGPFGKIRFCPTGGITQQSAPSYLALPNVACVGGGWIAPKKLMAAKDWDGIARIAKEAAALKRPA
jgi:2-dehydro-3-deoxyphosphogluconate aldolase/(4S)-4-hydroxy-2-oxoglutarate aldolase